MPFSRDRTPSPTPTGLYVWTPTPRPRGSRWVVHGRRPLAGEGWLGELPLHGLLHACFVERASGVLRLSHREREERLCLQRGRLASLGGEVDGTAESLGAYLLRAGLIDGADYEALGRELRRGGSWSELVARRQLLDPHRLFEAITAYERERALGCFAWTTGRFTFDRSAEATRGAVPLPLETPRLLLDGIARHYDEARLRAVVDVPEGARPRLREGGLVTERVLRPTTWEARLLELSRSGETLGAILAASPGRELEVRAFFTALFLMKTVGFELPRRRPDSPVEVMEERARATVDALEELEHKSDYFSLLGVEPGATPRTVRVAFRRRSLSCHPDRLVDQPEEVRERGDRVYRELATAQEVLTDPVRREAYRERVEIDRRARREAQRDAWSQGAKVSRAAWPVGQPAAQADAPASDDRRQAMRVEAERLFEEARGELLRKRHAEAEELLSAALRLSPDNVRYRCWLAWAQYLVAPEANLAAAEQHLVQAKQRAPGAPEPHLLLARLLEGEGMLDEALANYRSAAELAHGDVDVLREVQLFEFRLRRGKPRVRQGRRAGVSELVRNLFKRR